MAPFDFKRIFLLVVLPAFLLCTVVGCNRSELPSPAKQSVTAGTAPLDGANKLLLDDSAGDDWPAFGRTYGEQHFSPLTKISDANIKQLGLILDHHTFGSTTGVTDKDRLFLVGGSKHHAYN